MNRLVLVPLTLAAIFGARPAWSAEPLKSVQGEDSRRPVALAEALFREGRALMARGQFEQACKKLDESQRLDPATGTMLALALCHEGEGKLATAWAELAEVVPRAQREKSPDRERVALDHLNALGPLLSSLRITVNPSTAALSRFKVTLDGVHVESSLDAPLPVDGGEHAIEVTAAGKRPHRASVRVAVRGEHKTFAVPALEDETPPIPRMVAEKAIPPPPPTSGAWRGAAGWSALGVGAATLGVGAYFGVRALSLAAAAKAVCPVSGPCSDPGAVDDASSADRSAEIATLTIAAGAALSLLGVYLLATRPARVDVAVGPRGIAVRGAW